MPRGNLRQHDGPHERGVLGPLQCGLLLCRGEHKCNGDPLSRGLVRQHDWPDDGRVLGLVHGWFVLLRGVDVGDAVWLHRRRVQRSRRSRVHAVPARHLFAGVSLGHVPTLSRGQLLLGRWQRADGPL